MQESNIRHKILTIPGLYNSGPTHWQRLWARRFADCERIELGSWDEPLKDQWVERIAAARYHLVLTSGEEQGWTPCGEW